MTNDRTNDSTACLAHRFVSHGPEPPRAVPDDLPLAVVAFALLGARRLRGPPERLPPVEIPPAHVRPPSLPLRPPLRPPRGLALDRRDARSRRRVPAEGVRRPRPLQPRPRRERAAELDVAAGGAARRSARGSPSAIARAFEGSRRPWYTSTGRRGAGGRDPAPPPPPPLGPWRSDAEESPGGAAGRPSLRLTDFSLASRHALAILARLRVSCLTCCAATASRSVASTSSIVSRAGPVASASVRGGATISTEAFAAGANHAEDRGGGAADEGGGGPTTRRARVSPASVLVASASSRPAATSAASASSAAGSSSRSPTSLSAARRIASRASTLRSTLSRFAATRAPATRPWPKTPSFPPRRKLFPRRRRIRVPQNDSRRLGGTLAARARNRSPPSRAGRGSAPPPRRRPRPVRPASDS